MRHLSPNVVRFSSDDFPEPNRLEAFLALYGKIIVKHDLEPTPGHRFAMRGELYALPNLGIASASISPSRAPRRPAQISGDDVVLNTLFKGRRGIVQRGREILVQNGGAVLTSADPGVATVVEPSDYVCFRFSRAALRPRVTDLDARLLQPIPHDHPALRMLKGYIRIVSETAAIENPEFHTTIVDHIYDLAALVLGASRDGAARAQAGGVRAARLRAVKADILQHLHDGKLTLGKLAARHKISPRYIGMLFESDGTTYSEFVLGQRLARAYRLLACQPGVAISAIAFECGFGDLSYFNRAFRRRYGGTPSERRAVPEDPSTLGA